MIGSINIKKRQIASYVLMPQIVPRLRDLIGTGFYHIAYFIALVYSAVRLLPAGHAYANPQNVGRFGLRHVIAEAANYTDFNLKNIDKVCLFFLILLGLAIVAVQMGILVFGIFVQASLASGVVSEMNVNLKREGFASFFHSPFSSEALEQSYIGKDEKGDDVENTRSFMANQQDLAFMFLDLVFGIKGIFNSCVSTYVPNNNDSFECEGVGGSGIAMMKELLKNGYPMPIHYGVHAMFRLYNTGLLLIAVLVLSYFIATIVAETAQTGTPFGKRFNKLWAPLRFVVAFALLMPLANGFNSAQYIVLYAAKFGSNFATNGWVQFNENLENNYNSSYQSFVASPQLPSVDAYLKFLFMARTCALAHYVYNNPSKSTAGIMDTNGADIRTYGGSLYPLQAQVFGSNGQLQVGGVVVQPYAVRANYYEDAPGSAGSSKAIRFQTNTNPVDGEQLSETEGYPDYGTPLSEIYEFANGGNEITIAFGIYDKEKYASYDGYVYPLCGKMIFKLTDKRYPQPLDGGEVPSDVTAFAEPGLDRLQRYHWQHFLDAYFTFKSFSYLDPSAYSFVDQFYNLFHEDTQDFSDLIIKKYAPVSNFSDGVDPNIKIEELSKDHFPEAKEIFKTELRYVLKGCATENAEGKAHWDADLASATNEDDKKRINRACAYITQDLEFAGRIQSESVIELLKSSPTWGMSDALKRKGWAAAGIWYNKIAEMNGLLTEAVLNIPMPVNYPIILEKICDYNKAKQEQVDLKKCYSYAEASKFKGADLGLELHENVDEDHQNELTRQAKILYTAYALWDDDTSSIRDDGNILLQVIRQILGVDGVYDMRANRTTHPLAQLVSLGKSLVESSVRNMGYMTLANIGSVFLELNKLPKQAINSLKGFVSSITTILMTMGFILYYIVPFLPFIYFFFAVAGWVKGIFEALIGVPLWALAHIRIDGNGLPGQAAVQGYFLILEIMLRPLLTIFGLLASLSIFAALVSVLGDVWGMVTDNVGGYDQVNALANIDLSDYSDDVSGEAADEQQATSINFVNEFQGMVNNAGSTLDEFFFTIVYTMVVYMMGMASFKLIDHIPNNILRWMGQQITSFNDSRETPADSLVGSSYQGATQVTNKLDGLFAPK